MKNYTLVFLAILFISTTVQGQILTIEEVNGTTKRAIPSSGAQIVDINGKLEISIAKDVLIQQIRNDYPQFTNQLTLQTRINALEEALVNQENILKGLEQQTLNTADRASFYASLTSFYNFLLSDAALREEANGIFNEWRTLYGRRSSNPNSGITKEFYLLTNFNKNLMQAREELSSYKEQTFNISMLAHLKSKLGNNRVHIRGFDTYTESDIYTVPRWVTNLSADQVDQLKELQKKATDYNKKAFNYFNNFKAELLEKFPDLNCINTLKTEIETFITDPNIVSNLTTAVKAEANAIIESYSGLTELITLVKQEVSNWSITAPFEALDNAKRLVNSLKNTSLSFEKFTATANSITQLRTKVGELAVNFDSCYGIISKGVTALAQATGILKDQQNRYNSNLEIGTEVLQFSLDNLPASGVIVLEGAGPRQNGDTLEIDLVIIIPQKDPANPETTTSTNHVLESQFLRMQLIGLRSETVAGIILADSFNENGFTPVEDRRFLYAPAVSLLLKAGSRNSNFYNDFVDFGFGIAISSPDFNTDGTPEFGAGLMFTAFKDILSIGINYNVTLDTPYWSFGINLPFSLPGIPINVPK